MATIKGLWVFASSIDTYEASYSVNFTSNGKQYTSMKTSPGNLYYGNDQDSEWTVGNWAEEAYRIVDFGKQEQTVDDDFKDWMKENAKQIATADLTGTTWDIPAGWTANAGYGMFTLNGSYTVDNYEYKLNGSSFLLGYKVDDMEPIATANTFTTAEHMQNVTNLNSFTLTITDGINVSNPSLIYWLASNGAMRVAIDNPFGVRLLIKNTIAERDIIVTPVLQEKSIEPTTEEQRISADEGYAGLGKVTIQAIPANFREVIEFDFENDIEISGGESEEVTLISFTINGTTYQSPEGWKWEKWVVDTKYNTDGYYVDSVSNRVCFYSVNAGTLYLTYSVYEFVSPTDIINAEGVYYTTSGGSGN